MAKNNPHVRLQKLLNNELSSSNDKNQVVSGYKSLIDLLQTSQINKQLQRKIRFFYDDDEFGNLYC